MKDLSPTTSGQVGAVAVVSTLALLPVAWIGVRRLVPQRNIVFARWGFSHVALALVAFVAASLAATFVVTPNASLAGDLVLSGIGFGAVCAAIVAWAVRLDPDGVRVLGLRAAGTPRALLAAALAYVTAFPGIAGSFHLWRWILDLFGHVAAPQDVAARFAALPPEGRILPIVLGVVVQPLLEEVVFRSFLQPLFVQNFREVAGVALTSALFAALHGIDAFLPIFALSCVLGAVMLRTQSLWAVWFLHALNNGLMFALLSAQPELARTGGGS
jgi:membrane protease YdiL (CAAX protease family)